MPRLYNFSAGPAMLPEEVLLQVREELLNWHGIGASIMEVSHRGPHFQNIAEESERDLRELLSIPDNYRVLFLQGGGRLQFSMIPMNLKGAYKKAVYLDTGVWSRFSIQEAERYLDVHVAAQAQDSDYQSIPDPSSWRVTKDAAYFYYVDNETVNGLEFPDVPETSLPLVADMSSNLLSRPIDISRFGLIFAAAQKNIGLAGLTLVIIREDLLQREPLPQTPTLLRYAVHAANHSLYHTPSTFSWYVAGLVFKWLKLQGGISSIGERNRCKADKLYHYIDHSHFYHNTVDPKYRSRMNIVFTLQDSSKNDLFLHEAEHCGCLYLKGHSAVGGMRASIYNAMPEAGIDALIDFMEKFATMQGAQ